MPGPKPEKMPVYAVVRLDLFLAEAAPPSEWITVTEILPTQEEAEAEVARLNASVDATRVLYMAQCTRFFPSGRTSIAS